MYYDKRERDEKMFLKFSMICLAVPVSVGFVFYTAVFGMQEENDGVLVISACLE